MPPGKAPGLGHSVNTDGNLHAAFVEDALTVLDNADTVPENAVIELVHDLRLADLQEFDILLADNSVIDQVDPAPPWDRLHHLPAGRRTVA